MKKQYILGVCHVLEPIITIVYCFKRKYVLQLLYLSMHLLMNINIWFNTHFMHILMELPHQYRYPWNETIYILYEILNDFCKDEIFWVTSHSNGFNLLKSYSTCVRLIYLNNSCKAWFKIVLLNYSVLFPYVGWSFRVYLFSLLSREKPAEDRRSEKERTKTRIWWWFCFSCNQSIMCCLWTFVELLLLVNYLKWELSMYQEFLLNER